VFCLKIAIVNHDFSLGGVQRVAVELAEGLVKLEGYCVTLISFSGDDNFFYDVNAECKRKVNIAKRTFCENLKFKLALKCYKLKQREVRISSIYRNQLKGLISILREEDFECVILCQSDLAALIPKIKAELPSVKTIAWQHSDYEIYFTNPNYAKLYLTEYVKGLRIADHVVCLTKNDQKLFKRYNSNTSFIYNPLTLSTDKVSELTNNSIIFTGRLLIEPKGLDYFIQLVELSPSAWKFRVAGEGSDAEMIKQIVKDKGLASKIQFVGALKGEELVKHYLSGDVFVSTSRWEGFGLVVTEAMKCGLPIIAFDNHGPREILDKGKYGILIERFSVEGMHKELARLMGDYELRRFYQERSLERVEKFSLDLITEEWRKVIEK